MSLELRAAVADLRLHIAQRRFERALDDLVRKYRPDQPRAPKGTSEGGQWVDGSTNSSQAQAQAQPKRLVADLAARLESLGGGAPILRPSPKGATQFIFPNGMILRFDLLPGQYLGGQSPHINLHYGGFNYHIILK
ncbi:hypothetical protein [Devosia sp. Root635]|uniref:hypothetical protein n=1 Tax=Devosia sp. Root635 TaxID=1736575 RepID=UPI0012E34417|nr:hypothetical protein [Devosia sp. Root635]